MKGRLIVAATLAFLLLSLASIASAGNGAWRGEAQDPNYPELGVIEYLANPAGYHFWFTVSADVGAFYEAGHSYHNVYQVTVDDPGDWCGPLSVGGNPERAPYDLVGHEGESVYYKIFDTTTDTAVCP